MGEKEASTGREAVQDFEQNTEGRASDGSGLPVAGALFDEDSESRLGGKPSKEQRASNLNLSKSNINRTSTGDPDFDLAAGRKMPERDSETR